MFSLPYLCICIYCMIQLIFIFVMAKRRLNARAGHERYFLWMLVITFCSFIADIASSLYKGPDWFFPFAAAGNYIEILLNMLLLPVFFRYLCEQTYPLDMALTRRLGIVLWIMAAACSATGVSTAFTGLIFNFDGAHIYHRGPLFFIPMLILFFMMAIVEAFLISQRDKFETGYFKSLAFFLVAPLIGLTLQSVIYGLPFTLLGITFAAQIVFTNMQNRNIDKDYLTGAYTRQALDRYMQHKIDTSTFGRSFSAILLDIDSFKAINDRFGHHEGDTALINTVRLLRNSVGRKDFIARYGGDEFCVVMENGDPEAAGKAIEQIKRAFSVFNSQSNQPYPLDVSMGCAVYHQSVGDKAVSFFKVIDQKMYEEKKARRS